jgi:hypothetical protein
MSIIQPHSWCHVRDDNLTRVTLRSVNTPASVAYVGRAATCAVGFYSTHEDTTQVGDTWNQFRRAPSHLQQLLKELHLAFALELLQL